MKREASQRSVTFSPILFFSLSGVAGPSAISQEFVPTLRMLDTLNISDAPCTITRRLNSAYQTVLVKTQTLRDFPSALETESA